MSTEYRWLTPLSQEFLDKDYLLPGQTLDERVDIICQRAEVILGIPGFARRFKANLQKGWYSLSSPIWSNFGMERGLPISCFGSYIEDDTASIMGAAAEVAMMTKHGGGTSAYFGNLRERGAPIKDNGESSGAVHFMQIFECIINIISQGKVRRGNLSTYLPIYHPDIEEFLTIRSEGSPLQDISFGVTIPDRWMEEMIGDATPEGGDKAKRRIWAKVLEARANVGYPYLIFIDNVNKNAPACYRKQGMEIVQSNLCTEIFLPNNALESFVCDLASMNILYFDEWKNTDAVELLVYFLDSVMTEFIEKTADIPYMERPRRFAERHRALGIGWLGWHSFLQSKMVPFESMEAKFLNNTVAATIKRQAVVASMKMAQEYGEPDVLKGYGLRHTTLTAIAPTKSSAFILGQVSEGIEPHRANYYIKDLAKGKFTVRNPYLDSLLTEKGQNTEAVWTSILQRGGSVQHLEFLTDHEKGVFKTFAEISPKEVVIQAAQRQKFIDQGQSTNLMIHPSVPVKDVNALIIEAWRLGIKSLYYQISVNAAQAFARDILTCTSCES
jgi:ribonucleoside-diphosphate reductase alpha chain